jgi:hypothetical protein
MISPTSPLDAKFHFLLRSHHGEPKLPMIREPVTRLFSSLKYIHTFRLDEEEDKKPPIRLLHLGFKWRFRTLRIKDDA